MDIVDIFGKYVDQWSLENPERARRLLKTGWEAQDIKNRLAPGKKLLKSDRQLAAFMLQMMLKPLKQPERSVLVSVFTPCELIQEAGCFPYNVESFSCFLSASRAERAFLQSAEDAGLSETLCSYHKTFVGAALTGLLPKPACIVYTNLACDANLLTFSFLSDYYRVPAFAIDVPGSQSTDSVRYVADQLHELRRFLEKHTGRHIDPDRLGERLQISRATLSTFDACQSLRKGRYVPTDLVSPLYTGMTNNIFLGTSENKKIVDMMYEDIQKAPPSRGKHVYWMHTIPFWSKAVKDALSLNDRIQISGCELSQTADISVSYDDPYEDMAARLVYNYLNGSILRRINAGILHTRQTGADGAVWFNHWGCKHTLGGSQLARKKFEEAGIPLLVLDGDGCDRSHGGEGQTATRLGAFLEMLSGGDVSESAAAESEGGMRLPRPAGRANHE